MTGLTGNDQSLATHDEYYLHWSELLQSQLTTFEDGVQQFGAKDDTEEDDAGHDDDVGCRGQFVDFVQLMFCLVRDVNDVPVDINDHRHEAKTDDSHDHENGSCGDETTPDLFERAAHNANLEHHGQLDGDNGDHVKDFSGSGNTQGMRNMGVVGSDPVVEVVQGAGELEAHENGANEDANERDGVENEDGTATLVRLGEESQDDQQNSNHADLRAEHDAGNRGELLQVQDAVDVGDAAGDSIGHDQGDGLIVRVEAGVVTHCARHGSAARFSLNTRSGRILTGEPLKS